jgi:hypothetical protein
LEPGSIKNLELKIILELIQAVGAVGTTVGVLFAWRTLRHSERQSLTQFEDEFPREYRELLKSLPVEALLGKKLELSEHEQKKAKRAFFRYVDLCNEEVFLRQNGRVSKQTWLSWCGGIRSNLKLLGFRDAWVEIKKTESFAELKKLEKSNFEEDPANWGPAHLEETSVPAREEPLIGEREPEA